MQDVLDRPATAYMHRQFVILDENTNVAAAVQEMNAHKSETIIVTRDGIPLGIVTDSDILDKVVMKGEDSDQIYLKSIMTSPLITLSSRGSVGQAIQLMRINQVKRLPVTDNVSIVGLLTQQVLADAVRTSVLERTFRSYRTTIREHYKPIIGNLGFVLQFAGILMVVPALLGTALGEGLSVTGIYLSVVSFSSVGFVLNSYGEKRTLNLKQASILVVSSFVLLSLFGAIPYMYINPFWQGIDPLSLFVNSFFESASGFTTTGLSLISSPEDLPHSLNFYRSYTQWVGGLSFVYLVMTLFYPEKKLSVMKSVLGGGLLRFKQLLITVGLIFSVYTAALILFLIFFSETLDIYAISLIFSTVTGGGFIPDSTMVSPDHAERLVILGAGMIISALPFAFHYSVFVKEARTKRINHEVLTYGILIAAAVVIFTILYDSALEPQGTVLTRWQESAFHVVSASTNSGFQYINMQSLSSDAKLLLIVVMVIGGTAFSTAGGIKVGRFLLLLQKLANRSPTIGAPASISSTANPYRVSGGAPRRQGQTGSAETKNAAGTGRMAGLERKIYSVMSEKAVRESLIVVALFVLLSVITGAALSHLAGSSFEDGLFESVSALTTTGLSNGITSMNLDLFSKSMLIMNMIVGRFEIIAVFYIFFDSLRR